MGTSRERAAVAGELTFDNHVKVVCKIGTFFERQLAITIENAL